MAPAPALRPLLPALLLGVLRAVLLVPALFLVGCAAVIVYWSSAFPLAEWQVPALLASAAVLAVPTVVLRGRGPE